jgi:tRNA threonylcarbamoyladenosine modification (KEOPS) complex  Pcc1 subunit
VLSVGDAGGFTDAGGAIGVTLDDGRIRFDINRAALDAAQLRASANLLRLARNVRNP